MVQKWLQASIAGSIPSEESMHSYKFMFGFAPYIVKSMQYLFIFKNVSYMQFVLHT